jgi:hypothetical protein
MQRIEGMEELFLGLFLAFQELDVVDQQHVDVAISAPEIAPLFWLIALMKSLVSSSVET